MGMFKVATYNVNSLRSRLHIVIPWLKLNRPDVLCLQETKVEDGKFPRQEFEAAGYRVVFKGSKQYNGVAIVSLAAPEDFRAGFADAGPADEDRFITAVFSGIRVLNTYVPQGRDRESEHFAYKLAWFKRFRAFLADFCSPVEPLIWCGDLNVAPEPIDVHAPKRLLGHVCFNPEVWDAFSAIKTWGLVDVFRKHHPGEAGQYTFYDYRVPGSLEKGLGWRIDHILATPPLAERSALCAIDLKPRLEERPSDHTILQAEFHI